MTKYREIIRLTGLGFSQRSIMASCGVAQKTVVKVQKCARELNLSWPLDESMTDAEGMVGNISTWITAALRNEQFFSLAELNRAIREKLEQFNRKLF